MTNNLVKLKNNKGIQGPTNIVQLIKDDTLKAVDQTWIEGRKRHFFVLTSNKSPTHFGLDFPEYDRF